MESGAVVLGKIFRWEHRFYHCPTKLPGMLADQSKQNMTVRRRWRGTNWSKFTTKAIKHLHVQNSLEQ